MRKVIVLFFICIFLGVSGHSASAEDQTQALATQKPILGSAVPQSKNITDSLTKGLIYCAGIFFIGLALKKKYGSRTIKDEKDLISVLSRKSLSARTALVLVEVEGKRILLSQTADSLNLISEIDETIISSTFDSNSAQKDFELIANG